MDYAQSLSGLFGRALKGLGPRSHDWLVTGRGKQDYTILSHPINNPPVCGNKLSLSLCAIAVEVFNLSDGWGFSNPTLENTGEQTEIPHTNSNLIRRDCPTSN